MKKAIEARTRPTLFHPHLTGRQRASAVRAPTPKRTPIQNRLALTTEAVGEVTGDDGTADRTDGCDGDDHALTCEDRAYSSVSSAPVVSKPKSRPPREATMAFQ